MPKYSCAVLLELIYELEADSAEEAEEKAERLTTQGNYRKAVGPAEIQNIDVQEMGD